MEPPQSALRDSVQRSCACWAPHSCSMALAHASVRCPGARSEGVSHSYTRLHVSRRSGQMRVDSRGRRGCGPTALWSRAVGCRVAYVPPPAGRPRSASGSGWQAPSVCCYIHTTCELRTSVCQAKDDFVLTPHLSALALLVGVWCSFVKRSAFSRGLRSHYRILNLARALGAAHASWRC